MYININELNLNWVSFTWSRTVSCYRASEMLNTKVRPSSRWRNTVISQGNWTPGIHISGLSGVDFCIFFSMKIWLFPTVVGLPSFHSAGVEKCIVAIIIFVWKLNKCEGLSFFFRSLKHTHPPSKTRITLFVLLPSAGLLVYESVNDERRRRELLEKTAA